MCGIHVLGDRFRFRWFIAEAARDKEKIKAIEKCHPALGRHLTVSIMSGLTFRYAPEREVDWLV